VSRRPDRYEIVWVSKRRIASYLFEHPDDPGLEWANPSDLCEQETCDDLEVTRSRARAYASMNGAWAQVIERIGIEDVTPSGDPPGLIWDWSDEWFVEEFIA
jgi:hypothetical protein